MLQLRYVQFLKEHSYSYVKSPFIYSKLCSVDYIESQCLSLRVNLKNNAATSQGKKQGTFQLSSPVNGRLSWTSESQAIWYVPFYKEWAIGNLDDIGERFRGITSQGKESLGNSETYDPQDVLSWLYWNGDEWLSPDEKNDIILQCIECK